MNWVFRLPRIKGLISLKRSGLNSSTSLNISQPSYSTWLLLLLLQLRPRIELPHLTTVLYLQHPTRLGGLLLGFGLVVYPWEDIVIVHIRKATFFFNLFFIGVKFFFYSIIHILWTLGNCTSTFLIGARWNIPFFLLLPILLGDSSSFPSLLHILQLLMILDQ